MLFRHRFLSFSTLEHICKGNVSETIWFDILKTSLHYDSDNYELIFDSVFSTEYHSWYY